MSIRFPLLSAAALALIAACQDAPEPTVLSPGDAAAAASGAAEPAELVTVSAAGSSLTFWPYTGQDFSATPQDPINLILVGAADPVSIRAALFGLDGNRSAFGLPFDCTWSDAIGEEQTAFSRADQWEGSVIQLQCGNFYDPIRFHIRLFSAGEWTIANAHVDLLIPGTPNHQVLSWEVAEQLAVADLARSGLLAAPPTATGQIHASPFRTIPARIYNGLPPSLRGLVGGPMDDVTQDVPIWTDGRATVLNLRAPVAATPGVASQAFVIQFNQIIPKPFCNPGGALIHVTGPVELSQDVRVTASGNLHRQFAARGTLAITPIDPSTGAPAGPTERAEVHDRTQAHLGADVRQLSYLRRQRLDTPAGPPEQLKEILRVGPNELARYTHEEKCGR